MTLLATLALLLASFAALAVSMHKHHRDLCGSPLPRGRLILLRCSGWTLLAAALIPAIKGYGASIGIVLWVGGATAAVLAVAMTLTYRPRLRSSAVKASTRQDQAAVRPPAESLAQ